MLSAVEPCLAMLRPLGRGAEDESQCLMKSLRNQEVGEHNESELRQKNQTLSIEHQIWWRADSMDSTWSPRRDSKNIFQKPQFAEPKSQLQRRLQRPKARIAPFNQTSRLLRARNSWPEGRVSGPHGDLRRRL